MHTVPGGCTNSLVYGYTPGLVPVVSVPSEMRCGPSLHGQVAGWRGDWRCCRRGIPQSAPMGPFLFGKILMLNPAAPSMQVRACPLTQPTSPGRPGTVLVRVPQGPTLNSPQPAPTVSVCLPLRPYSPSCDFKQPGLSRCCSSLVWQGRGPLTLLSPWSPAAGPAGAGLGLQSPWSPVGPRDLFVLKQSPYLLFFQCPLYF